MNVYFITYIYFDINTWIEWLDLEGSARRWSVVRQSNEVESK